MKTRGVCGACEFESDNPNDFEVHEIEPEVQVAFCLPCVKTLELDAGK